MNETLSDKIEWVDDFYIREKKDTHPATRTPILNVNDVNEAVKELIRMIELENLNLCVGKFSNRTIEHYIKSIFGERLCE